MHHEGIQALHMNHITLHCKGIAFYDMFKMYFTYSLRDTSIFTITEKLFILIVEKH